MGSIVEGEHYRRKSPPPEGKTIERTRTKIPLRAFMYPKTSSFLTLKMEIKLRIKYNKEIKRQRCLQDFPSKSYIRINAMAKKTHRTEIVFNQERA